MTATGVLTAAARAKRLHQGVAMLAVCAMLGSCASGLQYNDYDEAGGISKKDYEDLAGRRGSEGVGASRSDASPNGEPPIPGFQSVIAAPSAPELADTRRVSIAVTETTPVRDILIELARKAGVDLEMDPRISGGVIMTATDRPFIEVIDRIADLAELRYRFSQNVLRVELDDPFIEQYRMDVLDMTRTATSDASSSTDASSVAQALGSGGGGGNNRSATSVATQTRADFWNTIGDNIMQLLNGIQSRRGDASTTIAAAYVPAAAPVAAPAAEGAAAPAGGGAGGSNLPAQAASMMSGRQAALDATIQADQRTPQAAPALQAAAPGGGAVAGTGDAARTAAASSQYSLNPQAGIITVFATQRQQRVVERYLRDVRRAVTQQVLIEAKVVEVTLSDQYRAGVDWDAVLGPNSQPLSIASNFTRNVVPPDFSNPTIAANWTNGSDLNLAVQMVKEFGTVRTLSSPRLTVLNNQVAMLKVARNQVFFELEVSQTDPTPTTVGKTTVTSQIKTVPVGLIMNVQPAVDPVTNRISLSLRPSITRITGFINDPGVAVTVAVSQQQNPDAPLISSPVPIIEVREMDSLVNLESGQTVVMGGLMQEENQTTREGIPGLMDIPLLGQAVAENVKQNKVTELVVFIRATLANAPGTIADEDIRLYKKFAPDPRPIVF